MEFDERPPRALVVLELEEVPAPSDQVDRVRVEGSGGRPPLIDELDPVHVEPGAVVVSHTELVGPGRRREDGAGPAHAEVVVGDPVRQLVAVEGEVDVGIDAPDEGPAEEAVGVVLPHEPLPRGLTLVRNEVLVAVGEDLTLVERPVPIAVERRVLPDLEAVGDAIPVTVVLADIGDPVPIHVRRLAAVTGRARERPDHPVAVAAADLGDQPVLGDRAAGEAVGLDAGRRGDPPAGSIGVTGVEGRRVGVRRQRPRAPDPDEEARPGAPDEDVVEPDREVGPREARLRHHGHAREEHGVGWIPVPIRIGPDPEVRGDPVRDRTPLEVDAGQDLAPRLDDEVVEPGDMGLVGPHSAVEQPVVEGVDDGLRKLTLVGDPVALAVEGRAAPDVERVGDPVAVAVLDQLRPARRLLGLDLPRHPEGGGEREEEGASRARSTRAGTHRWGDP